MNGARIGRVWLFLGFLMIATPTLASLDLPDSRPAAQKVNPKLLAEAYRAAAQIKPLLSLLVARNGYLVAEEYYNGSDRSSAYDVMSVSKSVLSGITGIAIEKGFLKGIDQPVSQILPEYFAWDAKRLDANAPGDFSTGLEGETPARNAAWRRKITIGNLLTMSAGYAWVENGPLWGTDAAWSRSSDWNRFYLELPFAAPPGEKFIYSTGATHVLSTAIARATHMTTREFAEEYLFRPMGIKIRRWDTDPLGNYYGGSEMYFTARDLMKYGQLYLNGGSYDGKQIISRDWVQQSISRHIGIESDDYTHLRDTRPELYGYGLLWWLRKSKGFDTFMAWGYGGQFIIVIPLLKLVVVATADATARAGVQVADGVFNLLDRYLIPAAVN